MFLAEKSALKKRTLCLASLSTKPKSTVVIIPAEEKESTTHRSDNKIETNPPKLETRLQILLFDLKHFCTTTDTLNLYDDGGLTNEDEDKNGLNKIILELEQCVALVQIQYQQPRDPTEKQHPQNSGDSSSIRKKEESLLLEEFVSKNIGNVLSALTSFVDEILLRSSSRETTKNWMQERERLTKLQVTLTRLLDHFKLRMVNEVNAVLYSLDKHIESHLSISKTSILHEPLWIVCEANLPINFKAQRKRLNCI
jgi:hypothetical protein